MRVTDCRFSEATGAMPVRAWVTVVVDEMLCMNGIGVVEIRGRVKLQMPRHRLKDGTWRDTVHPINQETRGYLEREILGKYKDWCAVRGI